MWKSKWSLKVGLRSREGHTSMWGDGGHSARGVFCKWSIGDGMCFEKMRHEQFRARGNKYDSLRSDSWALAKNLFGSVRNGRAMKP